jgi:hypothetical protein
MRRRPSLCALTLAVVASLLLQSLPPSALRAQEGPTTPDVPAPIESPPPPPPQQITVPPIEDPHLPSLALRLQAAPQWAAVGDTITATITVFNQAPDPADELTLTLPRPTDAAVVLADAAAAADGWRWNLGTLAPFAQQVVTATMRLTQLPVGEALLLEPSASARGLTLPITITCGVLVTTTPEARPGSELLIPTEQTAVPDTDAPIGATTEAGAVPTPEQALTAAPVDPLAPLAPTSGTLPPSATAVPVPPTPPGPPSDSGSVTFVPGQVARLQSRDGRISVEVPGNAFDRPLTLVVRTPTQQGPLLRQRGAIEPPPIAGFYRGFGAVHLEATDATGRLVTKFAAPLTLTMRFTPRQLQALGLTAGGLRIFWFDEQQLVDRGNGRSVRGRWVPQHTLVDAVAGTATYYTDHFSAFELSDGSSPSMAYLPSLQGW